MWASGTKAGAGISSASLFVNRGNATSPDFAQGNLTIDGAYHDLDLSGIVPEGATCVQLEVRTINAVVAKRFLLREKDYATNYVIHEMWTKVISHPESLRAWFGMNANRVLEYSADSGTWATIDITVVAHMIPGS